MIFITFPDYSPLLAVFVALMAVYYLLRGKDKNKKEDQLPTNISEAKEQCPTSKELRSTETLPEAKL